MNQVEAYAGFGRGGIKRALYLWVRWRPKRILQFAQRIQIIKRAAKRRMRIFEEDNILIPPLIILSATMECNLDCTGCYSRNYSLDEEMSIEELDELFTEAENLGVAFFVITGGEPLMKEGLLDLMMKHQNLIFLLFTNGTYVTQEIVKQIQRTCHIIPMLSVEGDEAWTDQRRGKDVYSQVMTAMARLKQAKVFFGFSTVVTTRNLSLIQKGEYYDHLIDKGCGLGLLVGYIPQKGSDNDPLLISRNQQKELRSYILQYQKTKPLLLMQMPDDEYAQTGVCMAAGRGFVHITAQGFVEPCPFSHYATHSYKKSSLKTCFDSTYFKHIRNLPNLKNIPHRGCALLEIEDKLLEQTKHLGVRSTEMKILADTESVVSED